MKMTSKCVKARTSTSTTLNVAMHHIIPIANRSSIYLVY